MCLKTKHPHTPIYCRVCRICYTVCMYVCMSYVHEVKYRRCMCTACFSTTEWAHRFADVWWCALPQASDLDQVIK